MAITRGVGPIYIAAEAVQSNNGSLVGTTAGRSLVAVCFWLDPASNRTPTVSVSGESDMTIIAGSKFTKEPAADMSGAIFYLANNTGGGSKTITVDNGDPSGYSETAVMEYTGMDLASQPDNSTSASGTSSTATTSLTTTTASALIVAGGLNSFAEYTAGSGYTLFGSGSLANTLNYAEAEDQLDMGAAGAKTVAFTGFGTNWSLTTASFKASGGAGTTPKTFTGTDSLAGGELL